MIRDNIKPGDYVYNWRYQAYIKVVDVVNDPTKYKDGKFIVCSIPQFQGGSRCYNMSGRLIEYIFNQTDYMHEASADYHVFNDLDDYYNFVKRTTNTPVQETTISKE